MIRHSFQAIALAAFFTPAIALAQLSSDVANLTDATSIKGTVKRMSKTEVVIERNGMERKVPVNTLKKLTFAGETIPFRSIRRLVESGNYEDALEKIDEFDRTTLRKNVMGTELDYMKAQCLAELGAAGLPKDKKAAVDALRTFLAKNPESYHYYDAQQRLGDLYASLGDYPNAEIAYKTLMQTTWPEYRLLSILKTSEMMLLQEKHEQAVKGFDYVISNADTTNPVGEKQKLVSVLGRAQCMAATGSPAEALKSVDKVIADNDPADAELFAKAYLAQGACHLKAKKYKDAALSYLHIDTLYVTQPEAHAEALYHLDKIWKQLTMPQRALKARQVLKSRYPGSSWAQKE